MTDTILLAPPAAAVPRAAPRRASAALYVAGVGTVGRELVRQAGALAGAPLRLVGACTTRAAVWDPAGLDAATLAARLATSAAPLDWPDVLGRLERTPGPAVFVDATGAADVARTYARLLGAGVHVVTPSKRANTFEQPYFDLLRALGGTGGPRYRYEATVGAGLPVVRTVEDLVATGDRVRRIEGVLSGTLTFLCSAVEAGVPFSAAVRDAVDRGYAEPDPRDDLSGEDVARKLLILARTAGIRAEQADIRVETLVPSGLGHLPAAAFLSALPAHDAAWERRCAEAAAAGQRLRYVARLDADAPGGPRLRVGLTAVPAGSAAGRLGGTDNLVQIWTDRYDASPLTVQGPGAGPAVTAAGILADVLDCVPR